MKVIGHQNQQLDTAIIMVMVELKGREDLPGDVVFAQVVLAWWLATDGNKELRILDPARCLMA